MRYNVQGGGVARRVVVSKQAGWNKKRGDGSVLPAEMKNEKI